MVTDPGVERRGLDLLWRSPELADSGKYGAPTIVGDLVLVGTDRLEAFGVSP
jgi:hypothetical protein